MPKVRELVRELMWGTSLPPDDQPQVKASFAWGQATDGTLAAFTFPEILYSRLMALSIPTIDRSRDLLCSTVGVLPFGYWRETPRTQDDVELDLLPWMRRPDPLRTRAHILAWTVDDLIFWGRAYWRVRDRDDRGFPIAFERMPFEEVSAPVDQNTGLIENVSWRGYRRIPVKDVVEFQGLTEGLLCTAHRAICTALKLDAAADRFADVEVPAGTLEVADGEDRYSLEELNEIADNFSERRKCHTTAALQGMKYQTVDWDAEGMQLTEARQHQALELSRHMNVPPWSVGAPAGTSMTYQNATQAKVDLIDFGAIPYLTAIEQTLSGPSVVPETTYVKFEVDEWLRNPLTEAPGAPVEPTGGDA